MSTSMERAARRHAVPLQLTCLIGSSLLVVSVCASDEQRMVSIGERRLSIDCDGEVDRSTSTVVLIAGGGRTADDWERVQQPVSAFARACSYDRAGFGQSDKAATELQSVDEVVDDLHALLTASREAQPFVLAAHSIAGFYARRFVTRYPEEVSGLVFVDSSHEEQALRLHELDPDGPGLDDLTARLGFYVTPGRRLEWRTELPLIVLGHGRPFPRTSAMTEEQFSAWDRMWRGFQEDLARRSTRGELRVAGESGHLIPLDQPDLVVQAIRDVLGRN